MTAQQHSIDLVRRIIEERDHLNALRRDISAAYQESGDAGWPGDRELLDRAERDLGNATQPMFDAIELLQQYIGSAEVDEAGLGVP